MITGTGHQRSGIWNYAHLLENGNMHGPREYDWDDDVENELVREYAIERRRFYETAYRYPYDHCPQLARLGTPNERAVVPPPHVRTFYAGGEAVEQLTIGSSFGDTEGRR